MKASQFKVGMRVKVVNPADMHFGNTGVIKIVSEEEIVILWNPIPKKKAKPHHQIYDLGGRPENWDWIEPLTPLEELL